MYFFDQENHIHLLNGKPLIGTSTAVQIIGKPALIQWAANMAVEYIKDNASEVDILAGFDPEDWENLLKEAKVAHRKKKEGAAEKGVDMHAELEKYVKRMMTDFDGVPMLLNDSDEKDPHWEKVQKFAEWSVLNVKRFLFSEAHCYSGVFWVGGIADAGCEMKNGKYALLDFKSSKDAYFSMFCQVGGYALQMEENGVLDSEGNLILKLDKPFEELYIVPFGAPDPTPRVHFDVEGMKGLFVNSVNLYKGQEAFGK